jgi:hypothetical protein
MKENISYVSVPFRCKSRHVDWPVMSESAEKDFRESKTLYTPCPSCGAPSFIVKPQNRLC